jgi:hypothetical protein
VSGVVATVFGASGFLGRYVVSNVGENGGRAVCPHRCDDLDLQHLRPMGDLGNIVTLQGFDIRDEDFIRNSVSKSNVVINLIAQNTETWNYGFKEVLLLLNACVLPEPIFYPTRLFSEQVQYAGRMVPLRIFDFVCVVWHSSVWSHTILRVRM